MTPERLGIWPFPSVHDKIADYMTKAIYTGLDKGEIAQLSKGVLPVYQYAVAQGGHPPFELGTPEGVALVAYLVEQTGAQKSFLNAYLSSMENMAKSGNILIDVWNPAAQEEIPEGPGILEQVSQAVSKPTSDAVSSGFNRVLIAGGIVAIVYLLGREYIRQ